MAADDQRQPGDLLPRPDPSRLTTEQLNREIESLRQIIEAELDAIRVRLDAMDKASGLLQAAADKVPSQIDMAVTHIKEVQDERFRAIHQQLADHATQVDLTFQQRRLAVDAQFATRDQRRQEMRQADKAALDAALSAARELVATHNRAAADAVQKSEVMMDKRMDQMGQLLNTTTDGLRGIINDLKDRVTLIEGKTSGLNAAQTTQQSDRGFYVALVAVATSVVGVIISIIVSISMRIANG